MEIKSEIEKLVSLTSELHKAKWQAVDLEIKCKQLEMHIADNARVIKELENQLKETP